MKTILVIIYMICLCYKNVFAQEINITGEVKHANSYLDIQDVNIFIQNTNLGTISYTDGTFSLTIPSSNYDSTIVFMHVSFHALRLPVKEAVNKNVFYPLLLINPITVSPLLPLYLDPALYLFRGALL